MTRQDLVVLDISNIATVRDLHALLAQTLHFPDWYGPNWDAFWDVIIGLVPMPRRLQLVGWNGFAERFPRDALIMQKCLRELAEEYPANASEVDYL
ncbi:RNAse (barnase) inhibitor barstar [Pseudoduganella lurida]|uniref:RNAse (Barnase) inhibitor barstar n=1 Tax=Pseudoduganella lurida TaxID=1036180 RepID=A0A562RLC9_9BURK|nr:barstar family protein [Pseudoduganella lurida]TWI69845.1 RNAse (barnase) inhibitor barstar [Pseudoduganella lurida]